MIKQRKDLVKLRKFLKKIYNDREVNISKLMGDIEACKKKDCFNITYSDIFFNPRYSRATLVGCMLAINQ